LAHCHELRGAGRFRAINDCRQHDCGRLTRVPPNAAIVWSLAQRTAETGVLPGAYPVIAWLMHLEEATQAGLSRLIGVEQPTMAITLRRMNATE
jgi:hypothetical protein